MELVPLLLGVGGLAGWGLEGYFELEGTDSLLMELVRTLGWLIKIRERIVKITIRVMTMPTNKRVFLPDSRLYLIRFCSIVVESFLGII